MEADTVYYDCFSSPKYEFSKFRVRSFSKIFHVIRRNIELRDLDDVHLLVVEANYYLSTMYFLSEKCNIRG